MKLVGWARANGVHRQTAYRWFREGRLPAPARRLESGAIWVGAGPADESGRVVVYARVSSHDQRQDLDRKAVRLAEWAAGSGHAAGELVTVVGSGLNGKRPKTADDLVRDMTGVLTPVCARLHGRRGARNRAVRAVTARHETAEAGG